MQENYHSNTGRKYVLKIWNGSFPCVTHCPDAVNNVDQLRILVQLDKKIESLESADERIIREKYLLHSKTSKTFLYLELGIVPQRFLIISRRIKFLWWILNEPAQSLIYQVEFSEKNPLGETGQPLSRTEENWGFWDYDVPFSYGPSKS